MVSLGFVMQEAKKRGRKDSDEVQASQGGKKVAAASSKGPDTAPVTPAKETSAKESPAKEIPAKAVSTKAVATKAVSVASKGPAEAPVTPAKEIPDKALPPKSVPAKSIPAKPISSASKGAGEAPGLLKSNLVPPAASRQVAAAVAAAAAATAAMAVVGPSASVVHSRMPALSSLFEILRGEFRKRQLEIPPQLSSDMSMAVAVQLAETLYVDDILKETAGNVSLAGKVAKIT